MIQSQRHHTLYDKIVIIGCGEVTQQRVLPAIRSLKRELNLQGCLLLDVQSQQQIEPLFLGGFHPDEHYLRLENGELPFIHLEKNGWLGPRTLVLNCTPTPYHVPYARQLAPCVGRVAVEKPLSQSLEEAVELLEYENRVFPIGHQLFKPDMLELTTSAHLGEIPFDKVGHLEFSLFENKGVGIRQVDDAVWDLCWHGIECLLAPFSAANDKVTISIGQVIVSKYREGPDNSKRWTAARIEGSFDTQIRSIPFSIRVGKGLGVSRKAMRLFDVDGHHMRTATLDESGSVAHERLIRELLTRETPNMQLGLRDVVDVVKACSESVGKAKVCAAYKYGSIPSWLTGLEAVSEGPTVPRAHLRDSVAKNFSKTF